MKQEEKIAMLEEVLEIDDLNLLPEMILDDLEEYDSVAKLALLVMFEDEFDKKISGEQIRAFNTIEDILNLME